MGEVVNLEMITRLDIPAERVLEKAIERGLQSVIVIGYDNDGDEFFASSIADGSTVIWLMERFKMKLLQVPDREA